MIEADLGYLWIEISQIKTKFMQMWQEIELELLESWSLISEN